MKIKAWNKRGKSQKNKQKKKKLLNKSKSDKNKRHHADGSFIFCKYRDKKIG